MAAGASRLLMVSSAMCAVADSRPPRVCSEAPMAAFFFFMTCVRPIKDQADAVPRAESLRVLAYEAATTVTTMGMQHGVFHANQ